MQSPSHRIEDAYRSVRCTGSSDAHIRLGLAGPRELPPQHLPGEFWNVRPEHIIVPAPNIGVYYLYSREVYPLDGRSIEWSLLFYTQKFCIISH